MKILNFLKINFNKNVNEVLRLAYKCGNVVTFLDKFDTDVVSIFSFKKQEFSGKVFHYQILHTLHHGTSIIIFYVIQKVNF